MTAELREATVEVEMWMPQNGYPQVVIGGLRDTGWHWVKGFIRPETISVVTPCGAHSRCVIDGQEIIVRKSPQEMRIIMLTGGS